MTERIKYLRDLNGWSQEELARRAKIGRGATISDIENGKANPRLSTLQGIAAALGCRVIDLFSAEPGDDPDPAALARRVRSLEEQTATLLRLVPDDPAADAGGNGPPRSKKK